MKKPFVIPALLVALVLGASASWGAIGVYKWKVGPSYPSNPLDPAAVTVPNGVSYMLNTDATEVKIEIKTQGSPPVTVRTWTTTDPANLSRGNHENVWFWDGNDDSGSPVPAGTYDVVVTATAAPIEGTDLVPLWETQQEPGFTNFVSCAINTNPGSPYFGYLYAVITYGTANKGIWMWDPAGSFVTGGLYGVD